MAAEQKFYVHVELVDEPLTVTADVALFPDALVGIAERMLALTDVLSRRRLLSTLCGSAALDADASRRIAEVMGAFRDLHRGCSFAVFLTDRLVLEEHVVPNVFCHMFLRVYGANKAVIKTYNLFALSRSRDGPWRRNIRRATAADIMARTTGIVGKVTAPRVVEYFATNALARLASVRAHVGGIGVGKMAALLRAFHDDEARELSADAVMARTPGGRFVLSPKPRVSSPAGPSEASADGGPARA